MPYKDKEKDAECKRAWRLAHKDDPEQRKRDRDNSLRWRQRNPERCRASGKRRYQANIEKRREASKLRMRERAKHRTEEQRQRDIERSKAWMLAHPKARSEFQKRRYREKPEAFIIRSMVARMVKIADIRKTSRSYKYIGCEPSFLRGWLQAKFRDGMTWDNYGEVWVVDHIRPLVSFELREHPELILEASHYSNLQPLFVEENLRKGFKVAG